MYSVKHWIKNKKGKRRLDSVTKNEKETTVEISTGNSNVGIILHELQNN